MIDLPPMPIPLISEASPAGGQFIEKEITTKAGTRKYKLYIPSSYDSSKRYSLVVMLHGCTQDADNIARGTKLNAVGERRGVLVAYPQQSAASNMLKCWNWYEPAHQKRDEGEPSIIASITEEIIATYSVDRARVYLGGVSAGGAMALNTAYAYPEMFAAVGIHSGIALGAASSVLEGMAAMQRGAPASADLPAVATRSMGNNARFIPGIVFQGGADKVVNPANARNIVDQLIGSNSSSAAMATSGEFKGTCEGGYHFTRVTYGKGRDVVEAWTVDELGHAWSGGSTEGTYTDPKGPDASDEMVRFFMEHQLVKNSR